MAVPSPFDTPDGLAVVSDTRRSWHWVAEWLMAGPQHRDSGTIRLQVVPGGFATRDGSIRVDRNELVTADGRRIRLQGTLAEVAGEAGIAGGAPEGLYPDSSDAAPHSRLSIDQAAADALAGWLERGAAALGAFAPEETPVLWPEHFDVGIAVDDVNYGISLGDAYEEAPYVYVGPWKPREGTFWNAPFGAARTWGELNDQGAVEAFLAEGKAIAAASA